ncbi:unnamed protein product [Closterium sp. Yama58-4]|nr:unnamed protein product [Closterium sp. Yama58-4]
MDSKGDALAVGAMAPEQMVRFHVARAIGRVAREQEMCLYGKNGDEKDEKGDGVLSRVGARVAEWRDAVVVGSQKIVGGGRDMEERSGSERGTMEEGRTKGQGIASGAGGKGPGGTGAAAASLFVRPAAIRSWSGALLKSACPPSSAFQHRNTDVTVAALHALRTLADISDDVGRISNDVRGAEPSLREGIALEALPQLRRVLAASTTAATHAASSSGSAPASASASISAPGVSTKRHDPDVPSPRAVLPGGVRAQKSKERRETEGGSVEEREEAEEEEVVNLAVAQAVASLVLGRRMYEAAAVGRLIGVPEPAPAAEAAETGAVVPAAAISSHLPAPLRTTPTCPTVVMPADELRAWGPVLVRWACGVMGGGGELNTGAREEGARGAEESAGGAGEGKGGGAAGKRGSRGAAAAGLLGGRRRPARSFLESNLVPSAAVAATAAAGQAVLVEVLSAAVHMAHHASSSSHSAVAAVDARGGDVASGGKDMGGKGKRGRTNGGREKANGKEGRGGWRNGQAERGIEGGGKLGVDEGRLAGVDVEGGGVGGNEVGKEWTDVAVGVGLLWLSEMLMCAVRDGEAARQAVITGRAGGGSQGAGGVGRKGEAGRQGGGKGAESVGMTVATMKYLESLWRGGKGAQGAQGGGSLASPADEPSKVHPDGNAPQSQALLGGAAASDKGLRGGAGGASARGSAGEKSWWSYVNPWGGSGVAGAGGQAAGAGTGQAPGGRAKHMSGAVSGTLSGEVRGEVKGALGGALSEKHRAVRDEAQRSASTAVVRLGEALGSEAWGWGGEGDGRGGRGERKRGSGEGNGGMGYRKGGGSRVRSEERELEGSVRVGVEKGGLGETGGEDSVPVVSNAGKGSSRSSPAAAAGASAVSGAISRKDAVATVNVTVDELVKVAEEEHDHLMDLLGFEGGLYSTRSGLVASNEDKPSASDEPPRVNVVEALDAAAAAVKALAELASEDWEMQEQLVAGGGVELMRRLLIGREYWEWVRGEEEIRRSDENGAARGAENGARKGAVKGAEEGRSQLDEKDRSNNSSSSISGSSSSSSSDGSESSRRESAGVECEKRGLLLGLAAAATATTTATATSKPNVSLGSQPMPKAGTRSTISQPAAAVAAGATAAAPAGIVASSVDVTAEEGLEAARAKLTSLQRNAARLLAQLSAHPDSWAAIAKDPLLIGWLEQCTTGGVREDGKDRRGRGSERASENGTEKKRKAEESRGGQERDDTAHLHRVLLSARGMGNREQWVSDWEEYERLLCEACVSKKMRSNARKVLSHAAPALQILHAPQKLHALPGPASVAASASTSAPGCQDECDVAVPGWHEPGKQFTPRYDDGIFFVNPTSPWLQAHSLPSPLSSPSPSSSSSPSSPSSVASSSLAPARSSVSMPPAPVLDVVFVHGLRGGPFKSWRRGEAVPAVAPPPGAPVPPVAKTPVAGTPVAGSSVAKTPVVLGPGEERRVEGPVGGGMRASGVVSLGEDESAGEKLRQGGAEVERVMGGEIRREAVGRDGEKDGGKEDAKSVGGMEESMLGSGGSVGEVEPSKLLEETLKEEEEGGKKGSCWPCDWLARDLPEARILTTKYRTNLSEWAGATLPLQDISILLLHKLVAAGVGERPVVFVTHSMGGLIVKQMLALARASDLPEVRAMADSTAGIVFYSVPHFGSRIADYSWRARAVLRPAPSADCLRMSSPHVEGLNTMLRHMHKQGRIQVLSFAETKVTPLVKTYGGLTLRLEVVPLESAYPGFGEFVVLDGTDHINACKPVSTSDPAYANTLNFLYQLRDAAQKKAVDLNRSK